MLATGKNDFGTVADNSYLGKAALNSGTDWTSFIDGSYDDAQVGDLSSFSQRHVDILCLPLSLVQWCILALWKIADYKAARGQDRTLYMVSLCV